MTGEGIAGYDVDSILLSKGIDMVLDMRNKIPKMSDYKSKEDVYEDIALALDIGVIGKDD